MTVGLSNTALLDLPLPVEGYFDGTWGNLVNYALTDYLDIAIAGTLTLTGDGAVTLTNTAGDDSANNITATSAQYAVIKIAGTLTTTKVITVGTSGDPAVSKTYVVDNAATGGAVTFKAYGQSGVSVAVGEKCVVYFNGTDFVKVASSVADGVTSVSGTGTVNGITLTGTVTSTGSLTLGGALSGVNLASQVTGTLPVANGGTGVTTSTGTGSTVLSASPTFTGTPLAPTAATGTNTTQLATTEFVQNQIGAISAVVSSFSAGTTGFTPSTGTTGAVTLAGTLNVANGGTGTTTSTGTGSVVLSASPTFTGAPAAPTAANGTNTTQIATTAFVLNQIGAISSGVTTFSAGTTGLTPSTGTSGNVTLAGTLAVANGGTGVTSSTGTGSVVLSTSPTLVTPILGTPASGNFSSGTFTWPTFNQNTSGTAAGLSATLAVASGGTGVTSSTGTGSVVLSNTPTLVTPILGTPTSGNLANCTFPTLNQNTTGTAASTPVLQTINFTISEVGGVLVFKYGATTIATMDSSGNLTTLANMTAYGSI